MPKYPNVTVQLAGQDGNVFNLMDVCQHEARKAGLHADEISQFVEEVTSTDSYNAALRVMLKWFDCKGTDEFLGV